MVAINENETLEDALIIIQAELSKALDARLQTLETRVNRITEIAERIDTALTGAEAAIEELMQNPMFKTLTSSGGFPGFGD